MPEACLDLVMASFKFWMWLLQMLLDGKEVLLDGLDWPEVILTGLIGRGASLFRRGSSILDGKIS